MRGGLGGGQKYLVQRHMHALSTQWRSQSYCRSEGPPNEIFDSWVHEAAREVGLEPLLWSYAVALATAVAVSVAAAAPDRSILK